MTFFWRASSTSAQANAQNDKEIAIHPAATFTVINTNDSGAGSLRQAITDATNNAGPDTINFTIPASDPGCNAVTQVCTVTLNSALGINTPMTIDGYTQSGAQANTNLAGGLNTALKVEISGPTSGTAFVIIFASDVTLRGLIINHCDTALAVDIGVSNLHIEGNFIGTNPAGTQTTATSNGITVSTQGGGAEVFIGGTTAASRNLISGTVNSGIRSGGNFNGGNTLNVQGNLIGTNVSGQGALGNGFAGMQVGTFTPTSLIAKNNVISGNAIHGIQIPGNGTSFSGTIQGNMIGVAADGTTPLGNGNRGISYEDRANYILMIGGANAGEGNIIAFNNDRGVNIEGGGGDTKILRNSIYSNGALGIDLVGGTQDINGVTMNDPCDTDAGPNNLQNFPLITAATFGGGMVTVSGTLNSVASTTFRLEFFSSAAGDPSGNGEGQIFLGAANVTTDGSCNAAFGPLMFALPAGQNVVAATATRLNGALDPVETSEFSAFFAGPMPTFVVINTNVSGAGSLRQAILDANGHAGTDAINFNIPASDPNCNATTHVCTIKPTVDFPLPAITDRVTINGYSQPGASANTLANGDDAVLLIELDGSGNTGSGIAFLLQGAAAGQTVIRGLVIDNGWGRGVLTQTDSTVIEGCFIGIDPSGTVARPNTIGVFADFGSPTSGMRIGGTTPGLRNVISGNGSAILFQSGSNHLVQGNFLGTNRNGTAAVANGTGITVQQSDDDLIGGTSAQARNIIAGGPATRGIVVTVAARTRIQGNFIGTDVTGTVALGFGGNLAVDIDFAASMTQIGGLTSTPGTPPGNVIAASGTGIQIGVGAGNVTNTTVMGNLIGTDASGTAPLGNFRGIEFGDPSNTVGGTNPMARNVISANGLRGILLGSQNNLVQGNFIGTDITGTQLLGNGGNGIDVITSNNTIGGISSTPGQDPGNIIAGNGGRGVAVFPDRTGISVLGNSIYSNGSLGIDLGGDGVTMNDHCDPDGGPNNLQNFPVIATAMFGGGSVTISGMLDSVANTNFRIEFFSSPASDPSGFGEGKTFLGSLDRMTDAGCTVSFGPSVFPLPNDHNVVSATATRLDAMGNPLETSEFGPTQLVPSAAGVSISGRVAATNGLGISKALLTLTDSQGNSSTAWTGPFGFYRFDDVEAGSTYILSVVSKRYSFAGSPRVITVLDELANVDFTASP